MKIFGYRNEDLVQSEPKPSLLTEITLVATSEELRTIAGFLTECAAQMEKHGKDWGHEHLSDSYSEFENDPQFIVYQINT